MCVCVRVYCIMYIYIYTYICVLSSYLPYHIISVCVSHWTPVKMGYPSDGRIPQPCPWPMRLWETMDARPLLATCARMRLGTVGQRRWMFTGWITPRIRDYSAKSIFINFLPILIINLLLDLAANTEGHWSKVNIKISSRSHGPL